MQHISLFRQIIRIIPDIPVVVYHVIKELVQDLVKFFVRPSDVEWPEPSAATKIG
jgi:hypothetical protein